MTHTTQRFLVIAFLIIAAGARVWRITTLPPGLFPDQAANGEDALLILDGDIRPFYDRNGGRESLFFFLQAGMIRLFGIGVWPMVAASALVGIATAAMTYVAGRRLFGSIPALFALAFLATNPWHMVISRTGFRAALVPLIIALTVWAAMGIVRAHSTRGRVFWASLAGLFYALGWYTYIAYRATTAVLLVAGILLLLGELFRRPRWTGIRQYKGAIAIALLVGALTLTPLAQYFLAHPEALGSRASGVSILNPELHKGHVVRTTATVVRDSVLAFFFVGDKNPRHAVPGAPFLSPLVGLLFLGGFVEVLRKTGHYLHRLFRGRPAGDHFPYVIVLLLLIFMLTPAVFTAEGIPHGLRSIGEIPAVFWIAGLGAAAFLRSLRALPSPAAQFLAKVAFGGFIALTIIVDLILVFRVWARSPETYEAYRADLTTVSRYLTTRAGTGAPPALLVLDGFSEQTVHFLTTREKYPYHRIQPEESDRVEMTNKDVLVFTGSTVPDAERYRAKHPTVGEVEHVKNIFGQTEMIVLSTEVPSTR